MYCTGRTKIRPCFLRLLAPSVKEKGRETDARNGGGLDQVCHKLGLIKTTLCPFVHLELVLSRCEGGKEKNKRFIFTKVVSSKKKNFFFNHTMLLTCSMSLNINMPDRA